MAEHPLSVDYGVGTQAAPTESTFLRNPMQPPPLLSCPEGIPVYSLVAAPLGETASREPLSDSYLGGGVVPLQCSSYLTTQQPARLSSEASNESGAVTTSYAADEFGIEVSNGTASPRRGPPLSTGWGSAVHSARGPSADALPAERTAGAELGGRGFAAGGPPAASRPSAFQDDTEGNPLLSPGDRLCSPRTGNVYTVIEKLGAGSFGTVVKCSVQRPSGGTFAAAFPASLPTPYPSSPTSGGRAGAGGPGSEGSGEMGFASQSERVAAGATSDDTPSPPEFVAVKVVRSHPAYYTQATMEIHILTLLRKQLEKRTLRQQQERGNTGAGVSDSLLHGRGGGGGASSPAAAPGSLGGGAFFPLSHASPLLSAANALLQTSAVPPVSLRIGAGDGDDSRLAQAGGCTSHLAHAAFPFGVDFHGSGPNPVADGELSGHPISTGPLCTGDHHSAAPPPSAPAAPSPLVALLDHFNHSSHLCLVFEYLPATLLDAVSASGYAGVPLSAVRAVMRQVLRGLAEMHSLHLCHADVKLENIMLTQVSGRRPQLPLLAEQGGGGSKWLVGSQGLGASFSAPLLVGGRSNCDRAPTPPSRQSFTTSRPDCWSHAAAATAATSALQAYSSSRPPALAAHAAHLSDPALCAHQQRGSGTGDVAAGPPPLGPDSSATAGPAPPASSPWLPPPGAKLIDFGSSCYEGSVAFHYVQSRYYRAPEVMLGLPYDATIDLWSAGCVAAELGLGLPLFPGSDEHDTMSRIVGLLGAPPRWMVEVGPLAPRYFVASRGDGDGGGSGGRLNSELSPLDPVHQEQYQRQEQGHGQGRHIEQQRDPPQLEDCSLSSPVDPRNPSFAHSPRVDGRAAAPRGAAVAPQSQQPAPLRVHIPPHAAASSAGVGDAPFYSLPPGANTWPLSVPRLGQPPGSSNGDSFASAQPTENAISQTRPHARQRVGSVAVAASAGGLDLGAVAPAVQSHVPVSAAATAAARHSPPPHNSSPLLAAAAGAIWRLQSTTRVPVPRWVYWDSVNATAAAASVSTGDETAPVPGALPGAQPVECEGRSGGAPRHPSQPPGRVAAANGVWAAATASRAVLTSYYSYPYRLLSPQEFAAAERKPGAPGKHYYPARSLLGLVLLHAQVPRHGEAGAGEWGSSAEQLGDDDLIIRDIDPHLPPRDSAGEAPGSQAPGSPDGPDDSPLPPVSVPPCGLIPHLLPSPLLPPQELCAPQAEADAVTRDAALLVARMQGQGRYQGAGSSGRGGASLPELLQFADFLSRMVCWDPGTRMSAAQALAHPFILWDGEGVPELGAGGAPAGVAETAQRLWAGHQPQNHAHPSAIPAPASIPPPPFPAAEPSSANSTAAASTPAAALARIAQGTGLPDLQSLLELVAADEVVRRRRAVAMGVRLGELVSKQMGHRGSWFPEGSGAPLPRQHGGNGGGSFRPTVAIPVAPSTPQASRHRGAVHEYVEQERGQQWPLLGGDGFIGGGYDDRPWLRQALTAQSDGVPFPPAPWEQLHPQQGTSGQQFPAPPLYPTTSFGSHLPHPHAQQQHTGQAQPLHACSPVAAGAARSIYTMAPERLGELEHGLERDAGAGGALHWRSSLSPPPPALSFQLPPPLPYQLAVHRSASMGLLASDTAGGYSFNPPSWQQGRRQQSSLALTSQAPWAGGAAHASPYALGGYRPYATGQHATYHGPAGESYHGDSQPYPSHLPSVPYLPTTVGRNRSYTATAASHPGSGGWGGGQSVRARGRAPTLGVGESGIGGEYTGSLRNQRQLPGLQQQQQQQRQQQSPQQYQHQRQDLHEQQQQHHRQQQHHYQPLLHPSDVAARYSGATEVPLDGALSPAAADGAAPLPYAHPPAADDDSLDAFDEMLLASQQRQIQQQPVLRLSGLAGGGALSPRGADPAPGPPLSQHPLRRRYDSISGSNRSSPRLGPVALAGWSAASHTSSASMGPGPHSSGLGPHSLVAAARQLSLSVTVPLPGAQGNGPGFGDPAGDAVAGGSPFGSPRNSANGPAHSPTGSDDGLGGRGSGMSALGGAVSGLGGVLTPTHPRHSARLSLHLPDRPPSRRAPPSSPSTGASTAGVAPPGVALPQGTGLSPALPSLPFSLLASPRVSRAASFASEHNIPAPYFHVSPRVSRATSFSGHPPLPMTLGVPPPLLHPLHAGYGQGQQQLHSQQQQQLQPQYSSHQQHQQHNLQQQQFTLAGGGYSPAGTHAHTPLLAPAAPILTPGSPYARSTTPAGSFSNSAAAAVAAGLSPGRLRLPQAHGTSGGMTGATGQSHTASLRSPFPPASASGSASSTARLASGGNNPASGPYQGAPVSGRPLGSLPQGPSARGGAGSRGVYPLNGGGGNWDRSRQLSFGGETDGNSLGRGGNSAGSTGESASFSWQMEHAHSAYSVFPPLPAGDAAANFASAQWGGEFGGFGAPGGSIEEAADAVGAVVHSASHYTDFPAVPAPNLRAPQHFTNHANVTHAAPFLGQAGDAPHYSPRPPPFTHSHLDSQPPVSHWGPSHAADTPRPQYQYSFSAAGQGGSADPTQFTRSPALTSRGDGGPFPASPVAPGPASTSEYGASGPEGGQRPTSLRLLDRSIPQLAAGPPSPRSPTVRGTPAPWPTTDSGSKSPRGLLDNAYGGAPLQPVYSPPSPAAQQRSGQRQPLRKWASVEVANGLAAAQSQLSVGTGNGLLGGGGAVETLFASISPARAASHSLPGRGVGGSAVAAYPAPTSRDYGHHQVSGQLYAPYAPHAGGLAMGADAHAYYQSQQQQEQSQQHEQQAAEDEAYYRHAIGGQGQQQQQQQQHSYVGGPPSSSQQALGPDAQFSFPIERGGGGAAAAADPMVLSVRRNTGHAGPRAPWQQQQQHY